jgi:ComF family protein
MQPPFCADCGRTAREESCTACPGEAFHHDRAHAAAHYEGKLKDWLHAFKFKGRKPLSKIFGRILAAHIDRHLGSGRFDAVLAVPADPATRKERGYNQSELLSRSVSRHTGLPDASAALSRVRSAMPQHRLDRAARADNVRDRFFVKDAEAVRGKRLLLVDDILTTGRTVSECARMLKKAGAARVEAIAVAAGTLK